MLKDGMCEMPKYALIYAVPWLPLLHVVNPKHVADGQVPKFDVGSLASWIMVVGQLPLMLRSFVD